MEVHDTMAHEHLTYLGHSAFLITTPAGDILIDPFLSGNPSASISPDDVHPTYILVTHGHSDHLGDTIAIAKRTGATVIGPAELITYLAGKGVSNVHPMHIGGNHVFPFGELFLTQALHGSSVTDNGHLICTRNPCGFVVKTAERTIYHAGDTGVFLDMELIGRLHPLDIALLPIGGNFTMGIDDAIEAVKMLAPRTVIPMHYGTFPLISVDPQLFRTKVETSTSAHCVVLEPGQTF
ncbi:MAG TPA: metal-dependent hydrolase [Candidatus Deferrimicrobium sp.]|nr:metal-dependent hydrolase [Candidatus Deferrimicrobium sp.]